MLGLAHMAWKLAYYRAWQLDPVRDGAGRFPWQPRHGRGEFCNGSAHREYYRICDRITRGEKP